jgi:hypothetical protein
MLILRYLHNLLYNFKLEILSFKFGSIAQDGTNVGRFAECPTAGICRLCYGAAHQLLFGMFKWIHKHHFNNNHTFFWIKKTAIHLI